MKQHILIKNSTIVNEGKVFIADILVSNGFIQQIGNIGIEANHKVIDGTGKHLFPGVIDRQVHFRDQDSHTKVIYIPNLKRLWPVELLPLLIRQIQFRIF